MPPPKKPIELHKRNGTYRPDRHGGNLAASVELDWIASEDAPDAPPPPATLNEVGVEFWLEFWRSGAGQWTKVTDLRAVEHACILWQQFRFLAASPDALVDPKLLNAWVGLSKALSVALGALGLTPADRAKLGVTVVKAKTSVLQQLKAERAQ